MLPVILKLKLATTAAMSVAAVSTPVPVPGAGLALAMAAQVETPVEVSLFDENLRVHSDVLIRRDGTTDPETTKEVAHIFRCRDTGYTHEIARGTLAMLADIAERYPGKTIEFVSAVRVRRTESATNPHRTARAIDFRIRGVSLTELRDYLWRSYGEAHGSDVGIGWYPAEQFIHMDSRPGMHDTAWTFLGGENHYHPYWATAARSTEPAAPKPPRHRVGV